MSSTCDNCDCADKSQCTKKGNSYGVVIVDETEKSYFEEVVETGEHDGKCKCGSTCTCTDCGCGK